MSEFESYDYSADEAYGGEEQATYSKKKKKRSGKKDNKLVLAAVAIATAFIVFIALVVVKDRIVNDDLTKPVVVAIAEVPKGMVLTRENMVNYFSVEQRNVETLPAVDLFTNGIPLVGKTTGRAIHAKELVTGECFVKESDYEAVIDPVELSIEVKGIGSAVAGTLRAGDIVDIKAIVRAPRDGRNENYEGDGLLDVGTPVVGLLDPVIPEQDAQEAEEQTKGAVYTYDMDGTAKVDSEIDLIYGATGEYAAYTIAQNVRVVNVYTNGGETADRVESTGAVMNATIINVVVPRSAQDFIFIAAKEGDIMLSKVNESQKDAEPAVEPASDTAVEPVVNE